MVAETTQWMNVDQKRKPLKRSAAEPQPKKTFHHGDAETRRKARINSQKIKVKTLNTEDTEELRRAWKSCRKPRMRNSKYSSRDGTNLIVSSAEERKKRRR
jgi:hypothetical protein